MITLTFEIINCTKKSMRNFTIVYIILFYFFSLTSAHAYLDPGTGSIILQAIIGFIAASITIISTYWNKLKIFIVNLFKKKKGK